MELSVYYVRGEFFVIYCNACVCELNSLYINVVSRVGYLYLENKSIIQKQWGDRSDKDSARGWWGMIRIIVILYQWGTIGAISKALAIVTATSRPNAIVSSIHPTLQYETRSPWACVPQKRVVVTESVQASAIIISMQLRNCSESAQRRYLMKY